MPVHPCFMPQADRFEVGNVSKEHKSCLHAGRAGRLTPGGWLIEKDMTKVELVALIENEIDLDRHRLTKYYHLPVKL